MNRSLLLTTAALVAICSCALVVVAVCSAVAGSIQFLLETLPEPTEEVLVEEPEEGEPVFQRLLSQLPPPPAPVPPPYEARRFNTPDRVHDDEESNSEASPGWGYGAARRYGWHPPWSDPGM